MARLTYKRVCEFTEKITDKDFEPEYIYKEAKELNWSSDVIVKKEIDSNGKVIELKRKAIDIIAEAILNRVLDKNGKWVIKEHAKRSKTLSGGRMSSLDDKIATIVTKNDKKTGTGHFDSVSEKKIAWLLASKKWNNDFAEKCVDYQTPIKVPKEDNIQQKSNKGKGEVDILFKKGNTLKIVEFKRTQSTESLLRCIMEIETYSNQVNFKSNAFITDYDFEISVVEKNIIVWNNNSNLFKQCQNLDNTPSLSGLAHKFGIKIVVIDVPTGNDFLKKEFKFNVNAKLTKEFNGKIKEFNECQNY